MDILQNFIKFPLFLDFHRVKKIFLKIFSQSFAPKSPDDADMIWLNHFFDFKWKTSTFDMQFL